MQRGQHCCPRPEGSGAVKVGLSASMWQKNAATSGPWLLWGAEGAGADKTGSRTLGCPFAGPLHSCCVPHWLNPKDFHRVRLSLEVSLLATRIGRRRVENWSRTWIQANEQRIFKHWLIFTWCLKLRYHSPRGHCKISMKCPCLLFDRWTLQHPN